MKYVVPWLGYRPDSGIVGNLQYIQPHVISIHWRLNRQNAQNPKMHTNYVYSGTTECHSTVAGNTVPICGSRKRRKLADLTKHECRYFCAPYCCASNNHAHLLRPCRKLPSFICLDHLALCPCVQTSMLPIKMVVPFHCTICNQRHTLSNERMPWQISCRNTQSERQLKKKRRTRYGHCSMGSLGHNFQLEDHDANDW